MDSNYLKYGDRVVLYVDHFQGYVSSQGYFAPLPSSFTNPNVFLQKHFPEADFFTRNYRDFVFEISPKLHYDARKDFN